MSVRLRPLHGRPHVLEKIPAVATYSIFCVVQGAFLISQSRFFHSRLWRDREYLPRCRFRFAALRFGKTKSSKIPFLSNGLRLRRRTRGAIRLPIAALRKLQSRYSPLCGNKFIHVRPEADAIL